MAEKIQERPGVFAPPNDNKQLSSYVINITFPQPVIRIRIPSVFVKAVQRRSQSNIGSKIKHHHRTASSKKSFRNKVGSVISTLFSKKKSTKSEAAAANGNGVDEEMKKLKDLIDSVDMGSEERTGENGDEVQPQPFAEGKETAVVKDVAVKERPKSRRTYPKRKDLELNRSKVSNVEDNAVVVGNDTDSSVGDDKVQKTVLEQAELRSNTLNSNGKPKIPRSVKRVAGKSEKQELCKKKILMGARCKPLNNSGIIQYDKNGVFVPDVVP